MRKTAKIDGGCFMKSLIAFLVLIPMWLFYAILDSRRG